MNNLKYLWAYTPIIGAFLGIYFGGFWSFTAVLIPFLIIPILEATLPVKINKGNIPIEEENKASEMLFFDILLYLNMPLQYCLLYYYFLNISQNSFAIYELVGMTFSVGIILGLNINVAHELGHRKNKLEQLLAQVGLLPSLFMQFFIEHNLGHHKWVATPKDPATARFGESLYPFLIRSMKDSYLDAWAIEQNLLKKERLPFFHRTNRMLIYHLAYIVYFIGIVLLFGWITLLFAIILAFLGMSLLQIVNYIEHYGLQRKVLPSGRYERLGLKHSWSSNHTLGRIVMYELTRHSDHHLQSQRKYQILRHFEESPQLPYGYSICMILAFIPSAWFALMNKRVLQLQN